MFVFEDFELDEDLFELRRGGERVALRPQALDVLLYLVKHRDRVVTKEELRVAIWSGASVSDTALPQAILAARRALGDEGDDPRYIQTVRARGYRFLGEPSPPAPARADSVPPSSSSSLATLPFVGRDELLSVARRFVGRAGAGEGGAMLVGGAVGAGKTRALLEIGAVARLAGATVVTGRCYDDEGVPPLWPWLSVVRALAAIDPVRAAPALSALGEGAPADGRFTTFDLVTRVLVDVAGQTPLAIMIDDLQWADPPSLLLLKLVAQSFQSARAIVVATHRDALADNRVLARAIGGLAREEPSRCVTLERLDRDAISALARAALGRDVEAPTLARLESKTSGSPLFLTQMLHALRSDEHLAHGSTSALLAVDTMREAVTLHLSELSDACIAVLTAAAVLEEDVTAPSLARMTGQSSAAILAALDEAIAKKILRRTDRSYAFVHELVRDVLYKQLGIGKRVELHEAAASALVELGDARRAAVHTARAAALVG